MFLFPRPQMRRQPAPVVGGAGSRPVAAAAPVPVVASAAAGYRRRQQRRRERGEVKEVVVGGGVADVTSRASSRASRLHSVANGGRCDGLRDRASSITAHTAAEAPQGRLRR